jgi:hypothetical protein
MGSINYYDKYLLHGLLPGQLPACQTRADASVSYYLAIILSLPSVHITKNITLSKKKKKRKKKRLGSGRLDKGSKVEAFMNESMSHRRQVLV